MLDTIINNTIVSDPVNTKVITRRQKTTHFQRVCNHVFR